MPKAKPEAPETYLCTPIRLDENNTYYVGKSIYLSKYLMSIYMFDYLYIKCLIIYISIYLESNLSM